MRLSGKRAPTTVAARGIGLEFARAYLAEGAQVASADVNRTAIFLATDESAYVVAQCSGVDGGNWMA